jgi:hypothetical protein
VALEKIVLRAQRESEVCRFLVPPPQFRRLGPKALRQGMKARIPF